MVDANLHERLDALGEKLSVAQTQLKQKADLFHDIEHLTARQLQERHDLLQAKIAESIGDLEAHGHHVNKLERSVIAWLEQLNT
jgi:HD superfamily phosphodiesterase